MQRAQPNGLPARSRCSPNRSENARNPRVAGLPKGGKRMLIQLSSCGQVALFARYVALLIDGPGGAAAIAEFLKNVVASRSAHRARG